jgi:hypothetical protein
MPMDMRKSFKDVASYMTPNKTNRSINNLNTQQAISIIENKVYKMIENCVKMECAGCRKLIPTHLFYEHINQNLG